MRFKVDSLIDRVSGWIMPPRCVLCGGRGRAACLDLCVGCEADLDACGAGGIAIPPLSRVHAAFVYRDPLDGLVQSFKYGGQLAIGRVLGTLLGHSVGDRGLHVGVDLLVPVPLHPRRHAERGFNQSAEIARWAGRPLGLPVNARCVCRVRPTPAQVTLPAAARRLNLESAFAADPGVRGARIAVVDDVTTTGSTLAAVARALLEAGATSVDAWCVARARSPEQVDCAPGSEVTAR
jgi:ComF family protein